MQSTMEISSKKLQIIPFSHTHASVFKSLNLRWLDTYFKVEPIDEKVLSDVNTAILNKGGFIFMGALEDKIIGCFALIPLANGDFELSKMAVDPKFQGRKFGQQLLDFAIDFAKSKQWGKLVLYSSRKLENAIYIYRKKGFVEIPVEDGVPYERCDIKMEIIFN